MNALIVLMILLGLVAPAQAIKVSVGIPVVDVTQSALVCRARPRLFPEGEGSKSTRADARRGGEPGVDRRQRRVHHGADGGGASGAARRAAEGDVQRIPQADILALCPSRRFARPRISAAKKSRYRASARRGTRRCASGSSKTAWTKIAKWRSSPSAPRRRGWARFQATGVVDAAMMTFPHNITAAEAGLSRAGVIHRLGHHPAPGRHRDP